jgi:nucleotide-binding universal stress UspA family protein
MSVPPKRTHPGARAAAAERPTVARYITRIAVGVDGCDEGRDAAALGAAIADVTGAELMLVSVHPDPMVPVPKEMESKALRKESERMLMDVRCSHAPGARVVAERDLSIARALHRVVRHHHRDLLVLGSSRDAAQGTVRIGKRTRQLLCHFDCSLAIAPRGLHRQRTIRLRRIAVGYDGSPESGAALTLAHSLAAAAGAHLHAQGVVDDRVPVLLRSALQGLVATEWRDAVAETQQCLLDEIRAAIDASEAEVSAGVSPGRPADALLSLSRDVDLLAIGSRRWGPAARLLLGSTGEALLHGAACPVLVVPRPAS